MILGNPFVFVNATHPAMLAFGEWLDANHPVLPAFKCYLISLVLDESCREAVFIDMPIDHGDLMPTILDSSPEGARLLSDIFDSVMVSSERARFIRELTDNSRFEKCLRTGKTIVQSPRYTRSVLHHTICGEHGECRRHLGHVRFDNSWQPSPRSN